jgi:hypothetical protein
MHLYHSCDPHKYIYYNLYNYARYVSYHYLTLTRTSRISKEVRMDKILVKCYENNIMCINECGIRENYGIQAFLSSMQLKNLDPYRLVIDSSHII